MELAVGIQLGIAEALLQVLLVVEMEDDVFVQEIDQALDGVIVPTEVLNFPIQGTAGDLANMAIRRVYESGILPLAQIHDAVLAEGTDGLALARKLKSAMELEVTLNGAKTRFPCDLKAGPDWLNMKEVKL